MQFIKLIVTLALCGSAFVWADVGMITQLSGEVSITTSSGTQAAAPFIKVNTGDKLTLANGARLQMVYFGNGRQEVWKGGGQIEVGSLDSKSAIKPDVSQLPPLVALQLAKMPVAGQQGKTGMIRMRAAGTSDTAANLDKQYGDLKRRAEPDDTTPEVYLLSGLIELKDFKRAKSVLAELNAKAGYQPVVDYFTPMVNAGGK
jgi:hypothetical protein